MTYARFTVLEKFYDFGSSRLQGVDGGGGSH